MNFITLKVLSLILLLKPPRINEDIVNEFGVNNVNLIVDDVNKLLDIITLVTGVVEVGPICLYANLKIILIRFF